MKTKVYQSGAATDMTLGWSDDGGKVKVEEVKRKKTTYAKRKKSKGRMYFTQVHQDAIVRYASIDDRVEREQLYRGFIGPTFNEMVDKIVFTYKFTSLPNVDEYKSECKVWLTTILEKFDPNKGSKAFSYFSVITKNWFLHKVKKVAKQNRREILHEDIVKESDLRNISTENDYDATREEQEFWQSLWSEIGKWRQIDLKENEKKVLEAVCILLANPDDIEIFNKKAIYLYIREMTDLNTKQVVSNLNRIRTKYKAFKKEWNEAEYEIK